MKNTRNSNIELLRIISMLMIIAHHYCLYGVMQSYDNSISNLAYTNGSSINKIIVQLLLPGGVIGVNVFFLIMGYFGIGSDKINVKRTINKTILYSILGSSVYIVECVMGIINDANIGDSIIKSITPICNSSYWFISVYIL